MIDAGMEVFMLSQKELAVDNFCVKLATGRKTSREELVELCDLSKAIER